MDRVLAATQLDLFWVPSQVTRLDRPDVLALHDGTTAELTNQVLYTNSPDLHGLVREIDRFHTSVSQWLVVPPFQGAELEEVLPQHGYTPAFRADGYTLPTHTDISTPDIEVRIVSDLQTLDDNLVACGRAFRRPTPDLVRARELALCVEGARSVRMVAYLDGELAGSGNLNRYDDLSFGFLWAGGVVPEHQGKGVYRALLDARLRWAREQGLARIGLYANRDTSAPVVAKLGFEKHGPMAYFQRRPRPV